MTDTPPGFRYFRDKADQARKDRLDAASDLMRAVAEAENRKIRKQRERAAGVSVLSQDAPKETK